MAEIGHFSKRLPHKYAWFCEPVKITLPPLAYTDFNSLSVRFGVRSYARTAVPKFVAIRIIAGSPPTPYALSGVFAPWFFCADEVSRFGTHFPCAQESGKSRHSALRFEKRLRVCLPVNFDGFRFVGCFWTDRFPSP